MTNREIMQKVFKHQNCSIVPYKLPMEKTVIDKLNDYYGTAEWMNSIKKFFTSPINIDTLREEKINERYAKDVFGSIWRCDKLPWHLEKPILQEPTLAGYKFPVLDDFIAQLDKNNAIEKAQLLIKENRDQFYIINMGWGIFEQTWRIRGFENALMDMITDPEFYAELVGRITELYVGMVYYCRDIKADGILFGDDWGDQRGVIMGPALWRKFIKPAWKKVYDEVHRQGKYAISHSCGSVAEIIPEIIENGLDMLESVQPEANGMNPYRLKKKWGDKLCFWGGLGSQSTIPFGTVQEIKDEVNKLRNEMSINGGYILAPAKPLQSDLSAENAAAVFEAFTSYTNAC